jgi:hypothetical protein
MITREKLEEIMENASLSAYLEEKIDHKMKALMLLRERIPYEVCRGIIGAAEHDIIYLCDIDEVIPYINEDDAKILAECNLFIDSDCDCLSMFA